MPDLLPLRSPASTLPTATVSVDPGPLLLDIAAVANLLTVSESGVRRLIADGRFPKPRKLNRSARWHIDDVRAAAKTL